MSALLAMAALATPIVQTSNVGKDAVRSASLENDPNLQQFWAGKYTVYSDLGSSRGKVIDFHDVKINEILLK